MLRFKCIPGKTAIFIFLFICLFIYSPPDLLSTLERNCKEQPLHWTCSPIHVNLCANQRIGSSDGHCRSVTLTDKLVINMILVSFSVLSHFQLLADDDPASVVTSICGQESLYPPCVEPFNHQSDDRADKLDCCRKITI